MARKQKGWWSKKDCGSRYGISEAELRLAVATLGVKSNRLLYRKPDSDREITRLAQRIGSDSRFDHLKVATSDLLEACERFAKLQPNCTGAYNLGWVAEEKSDQLLQPGGPQKRRSGGNSQCETLLGAFESNYAESVESSSGRSTAASWFRRPCLASPGQVETRY